MNFEVYFKSIIEQDLCSVVICNLDHEIIYMNRAAIENYENRGGAALVGQSLMTCHNPNSQELIQKVIDWFSEDEEHNRIFTFHNPKQNKDVYMVALRDENGELIGYYEKHEYRDRETSEPYAF